MSSSVIASTHLQVSWKIGLFMD